LIPRQIVVGCEIVEGILKVGTPLCIPELNFLEIGSVASIQSNHKEVDSAKKVGRAHIIITTIKFIAAGDAEW